MLFLKITKIIVAIFINSNYYLDTTFSKEVAKIKLKDIAIITQGANTARIEVSKETSEAVEVHLLTLRQFNKSLGLPYRMLQSKEQLAYIKKEKYKHLLLTKKNRLLIHLQSQKAAVLPKEDWNLLIPSNFVALDFKEDINTGFMMWYLNEHPHVQKQIYLSTQGSSITTLSINMLREIEVTLPPIEIQGNIEQCSLLYQKKQSLVQERTELENQWVRQLLLNKLEEIK